MIEPDIIMGHRFSHTIATGLFSFVGLVSLYYTVVTSDLVTPPTLTPVDAQYVTPRMQTSRSSNGVKGEKDQTLFQDLVEDEEQVERRKQQDRSRRTKMNSWIITACASLVMTLGALPFLYDLLSSGFDVAAVGRRDAYSQGLCAFFIAYLVAVSSSILQ